MRVSQEHKDELVVMTVGTLMWLLGFEDLLIARSSVEDIWWKSGAQRAVQWHWCASHSICGYVWRGSIRLHYPVINVVEMFRRKLKVELLTTWRMVKGAMVKDWVRGKGSVRVRLEVLMWMAGFISLC